MINKTNMVLHTQIKAIVLIFQLVNISHYKFQPHSGLTLFFDHQVNCKVGAFYLSNCLMTWNFSRLLCLQHLYLYSWCHSSISKLLCRQEIWNDVKAVSFRGFIVYEITDRKKTAQLVILWLQLFFVIRFIAPWNQVHYFSLSLWSH